MVRTLLGELFPGTMIFPYNLARITLRKDPYLKKLIEVAPPLDAINATSAREKSIPRGQ